VNLGPRTRGALAEVGLDAGLVAVQVQRALDEDLAYGPDVTSLATVPADQWVRAQLASRSPGVLCGLPVAMAVFDLVIGDDRWLALSSGADGDVLMAGSVALELEAPTRDLLIAERTALNFLGHLSGVASLTARWVAAVSGTGVLVRDTRKTIPGLRVLDKYAVRCGGGVNHRMGLGDAALVKDNHVLAAGGVSEAVTAVQALDAQVSLEVECDSLEQAMAAVEAGVSLLLLDNMPPEQLAEVVGAVRAKDPSVKLEASGGLTLETVRAVAETGVDYVAVGALTHSAPVLDLGLDVTEVRQPTVDRVGQ
jgi:nicotinate-nucleotide pyrophosphorylase (carboxylating)